MRLAFVVGAFPEVSTTFILDQVTGLLDLGHDVHVFARTPHGSAPVHADFARYGLAARTHYWWSSPRATQSVLRSTARLLREAPRVHGRMLLRAFDVRRLGWNAAIGRWWSYAATMRAEPPFDAVLAQFGPNGRIALQLRDLGAFDAPIATTWLGYDLSKVLRQHGRAHYTDLLARSELMLPLSEHFAQRLVSLGCAPEKIRVHHVGIDLERFRFAPRVLPSGARVRIITVCRLVEKKGLEFALRALAQVRDRGVSFEYHLVGDGPLRSRLARLRSELQLEELVTLHGAQTREQVQRLLSEAHLFLSPSVTAQDGDEEGVPAAIKEAMAAGLPVVSTYHAAIPEVIEDGVSGLLVPERDVAQLADRLAQLATTPERWPALAHAARAVVEREYDLGRLNAALSETLAQLARDYREVRREPRAMTSPR